MIDHILPLITEGRTAELAEALIDLPGYALTNLPAGCLGPAIDWLADAGRMDEAVVLYHSARAVKATVSLPTRLAQVLDDSGQRDAAIDLLAGWQEGERKRPQEYIAQANALIEFDAPEAALRVFAAACQAFPTSALLALRRGQLLLRGGAADQAAAEFARALDVDPFQPNWLRQALKVLRGEPGDVCGLTLHLPPEVLGYGPLNSILTGRYENVERRAVLADLQDGDRVLELGTGIGAMACWIAAAHPGIPVTTVEANPDLAPVIARNFALNGCKATALSGIAALTDGEAEFHVTADFWASSTLDVEGAATHRRVATINVDRLMAEQTPTILIMDIEGGEAALLSAMRLDGLRRIIVEVHPSIIPAKAITAALARLFAEGFILDLAAGLGRVIVLNRPA